jgi:hypothetical protein
MKKTNVQGLKIRRNKRKVTKEMAVALHKLYSNLIADAKSNILPLLAQRITIHYHKKENKNKHQTTGL